MIFSRKLKRYAFFIRISLFLLFVIFTVHMLMMNANQISTEKVQGSAKLRRLFNQTPTQGTLHNSSTYKTNLILESERFCTIPKNPNFPVCSFKIQSFNNSWNEKCHGTRHKVNRKDLCSVILYLSEVESWCPVLPWRRNYDPYKIRQQQPTKAKIRTSMEGVLHLLKEKKLAWMRSRIKHAWSHFVEAIKELSTKQNMVGLPKKKIYVFFGTFSFLTFFLDNAFKGGPLGELVQWTDVIGSLYILGHDLVVTLNDNEIKRILTPADKDGCATRELRDNFDYILTDIYGYWILKRELGPNVSRYRCRLMILDSFGTDAEFNYKYYKDYLRPKGKSNWGKLNLFLGQFFTLYPHSPDNSFMGFAVPARKVNSESMATNNRSKMALVYGKDNGHWKGMSRYLDEINKYFEIHANVDKMSQYIPSYVHNHGVVNSSQFMQFLQKSKVFVGLGEPYEGPGPLDALANGCFFINPKFQPPKGPLNTAFFEDKPMSRTLTSQNPYAEIFVGKPFVHTIDINNVEEIKQAAKEIKESKMQPHLPYEFSHEGLLQRLSAYIQNQDFCQANRNWPPISDLHRIKGEPGESCIDACLRKTLICENTFFVAVNQAEELSKFGFQCKSYITREATVAPSFNQTDGSCLLQEQSLLFSCRARAPRIQRLCTCRTYIKEQVALCKSCA